VDAVQNLLLNVPERLLPPLREDFRYGAVRDGFQYDVGVEEVVGAHSSGHGVSHGALSAAHHADQVDIGSLQSRGEEARWVHGHAVKSGVLEGVFHALVKLFGVVPFEATGVEGRVLEGYERVGAVGVEERGGAMPGGG